MHSSGRPRTTGTAKLSRMSGTSRSARSGTLGRQGFRDDIWPARRPLDIVVAGEVTAHCSQRENVRQPFRFVNGKRFGESSSAGRSRRHGRQRADPCPPTRFTRCRPRRVRAGHRHRPARSRAWILPSPCPVGRVGPVQVKCFVPDGPNVPFCSARGEFLLAF